MEKILTGKQALLLDKYTIENGTDSETLIGRAATALADTICSEEVISLTAKSLDKMKVLCIAGPGNNGADAVCLAEILTERGIHADTLKVGKNADDSTIKGLDAISDYDVIADGLFGVGLNRNPEGSFALAIEKINAAHDSGTVVIAVDIPSGVSADDGKVFGNAVKADISVTFGYRKCGHVLYPGREYCGKIYVRDIGFDKTFFDIYKSGKDKSDAKEPVIAETIEEADVAGLLPKRFPNSNKGSYGHVLLICGSQNMPGAAVLASKAAYRCGAGHVTVCSDPSTLETVVKIVPETVLADEKEIINISLKDAEKMLDKYDSVLIGPGIGKSSIANLKLKQLTEARSAGSKATVIDADGINLLAELLNEAAPKESIGVEQNIRKRLDILAKMLPENTVFTPHRKELSRLLLIPMEMLNNGNKWLADIIAESTHQIFVLKEASTIVATLGKVYINTTGNSGLAKAGSGDVLAGMLAALAAQADSHERLVELTVLAVNVHGAAGDLAKEEFSEYGVMASELPEFAAKVIKKFLR